MKVVNIHKRIINQPKREVSGLLETLSTKNDKIWPVAYWPRMKLDNGLKTKSKGGHGIIGYVVEDYIFNELIVFKFSKPKGFHGIHKFEIIEDTDSTTKVMHSIIMNTKGRATLQWYFVLQWLHNALIENAFDAIENNYTNAKVFTKWNLWVKFWRFILK